VTAAGVVIGNEILTAKVEDLNGPYLIKRLRERGVPLRLLIVVPDEVDAIVDAIVRARRSASHVITSGGIGPTHDDVTVRAVAMALARPVVRLPEMEAMVREHYGAKATPEAMRLADAPQGARLLRQEGVWYPVLACEGVFMLPGVPSLFRLQLEAVLGELQGEPIALRILFVSHGEPEIAGALDAVALSRPEVSIGSYPQFDRALDFKVKVTIEHKDPAVVEEVAARITALLPPGAVLRTQ
jgi:molybdenum cofactor synthesis domain-containing protein